MNEKQEEELEKIINQFFDSLVLFANKNDLSLNKDKLLLVSKHVFESLG